MHEKTESSPHGPGSARGGASFTGFLLVVGATLLPVVGVLCMFWWGNPYGQW